MADKPSASLTFNIYRNGTPLLRFPVSEEEARQQFDALLNIFVKNKQDICEKKNSFELYGIVYEMRRIDL